MYCTEKTLYLLWESNKRFVHLPKPTIERPLSPTMTRSRSPSPTLGRQTPPTLGRQTPPTLGRKKLPTLNQFGLLNNNKHFISCSSLKQLDDFDIHQRDWREVSEKYIAETLSIAHDIPYKIQNIYINNDCRCVFKVFAYKVDIEKIKEDVTKYIQIFENINVVNIVCEKYIANPETTVVRVNCSTKDICIFTLLAREHFTFMISLNNLEQSPKYCFDAFRSLCRTDRVLTDLFDKSIVQYLDIARERVVPIISGIVNYNNGQTKKSND